MSIITVFSKKKRNVGESIVIMNTQHNTKIIGKIIGKHSDNPKYQNHKISANRVENTGKDYYLVNIEDK